MPLQHDAFERRAFARAAICNQLKRTGHFLEFRPEERVGLVSGCICRWIKKAFYYFTISKADRIGEGRTREGFLYILACIPVHCYGKTNG